VQPTNRYYTGTQGERRQDPARAHTSLALTLTLDERIDALWGAWTRAYPP